MSNVDNLSDNDDLISILSSSLSSTDTTVQAGAVGSSSNSLSVVTDETKQEKDEVDKKLSEIRELADVLQENTDSNPGSGDLDVDLSDWFKGKSTLPSDELNVYVGNPDIKMVYGLSKNVLTSFDMMGKLHKFLEGTFDTLFSDAAMMSLTPSELEERSKMAFTMYERLATINNRAVLTLREQNNRFNTDSSEIDRLSMLLSSIPSEKLESILQSLTHDTKKKSK